MIEFAFGFILGWLILRTVRRRRDAEAGINRGGPPAAFHE